jgi:hypothetical protein
MDHYYILGADGFLGFEVCLQLLNEGYKVTHIPLNERPFPEEKLLYIGRNSNFQIIEGKIEQCSPEYKHLIIPFYDWSTFYSSEETYEKRVLQIVQSLSPFKQITCLLHETINFKSIFENLGAKNVVKVYYPYLYGTNIPKDSLFYQGLTKENIESNLNILNVIDAASETIKILTTAKEGTFVLKNKNKKRWQECLHSFIDVKSHTESSPNIDIGKEYNIIEIEENKEHASFPKSMKKFIENDLQKA